MRDETFAVGDQVVWKDPKDAEKSFGAVSTYGEGPFTVEVVIENPPEPILITVVRLKGYHESYVNIAWLKKV